MPDSTKIIININDSISSLQLKELKSILIENQKTNFLQIEESFWQNIIIPILLPIIAFVLGLLINWIFSKIKLSKSLKEKQEFLYIWIGFIEKPVIRQIEALRKYATELITYVPKSGLGKVNLHLDKLKLISSLDLVAIFVTNKKGNSNEKNNLLFILEQKIDFLIAKQNGLQYFLDPIKNITEETTEKWNDEFIVFYSKIRDIYQVYNSSNQTNSFYEKLLNNHAEWSINGLSGMKGLYDLFLVTMGPKCSEYFSQNPSDTLISELIISMKKLHHLYESRSKVYANSAELIHQAANDIEEAYKDLLEAKNKIAMLKRKSLIYLK